MRQFVLVPFDRAEAITVKEAAEIWGRTEATVRDAAAIHGIGRRVGGGPWKISRVALAMHLDGNRAALKAYQAGDRASPLVVSYFTRYGLHPQPVAGINANG